MHAKDAAGNWGPTATTTLVVDKTRPTVVRSTATPNPTQGRPRTLTSTATDRPTASTAVTRAEWFRGTDPGVGHATAMT